MEFCQSETVGTLHMVPPDLFKLSDLRSPLTPHSFFPDVFKFINLLQAGSWSLIERPSC